MSARFFALTLALAATACDRAADTQAPGTSISVNATSETDEKLQLRADGKTGQVSVNVPGLDAQVRLPKVVLDNSNFDLDGVTLYPGSTVSAVNVDAKDKDGAHEANVRLAFTAPADPARVRDWFAKALGEKAATVRTEAGALIGQMQDGTAYRMEFAAGDKGATKGTILIRDKR